ncbi:hypothetical protein FQV26_07665 [Planococcus sp. CPCC 101016]|uniref:hypothetical protein n=1 Tax=Planococcus sp. CPCC 101016 TaxID=2599617 RepID=UPI0011B431B0|nr:hypothetical protein [Planococcus sp. CPCC 101016]TWT07683.1 hypothetical protein FQV26_07665 [Planococcus sp. CPCC 101016]
MKYILNGLITVLLSILGFYAILVLLIFTVSDSDEVVLYAFAIVLGVLLIVIINQLVRLNDKLEAIKSELN